MKRILLATTAALAFAAPVMAQSDAELAVSDALMTRGYTAAQIELLTDAQVAELYLALTSEDAADVDAILSGIEFGSDTGSDVAGDSMQLAAVDDILVRAGYPEGTVERLTSAQVTEVFIASTSEDASDVSTIIDGFGLDSEGGSTGDSDAALFVRTELDARGVDPAVIAGLTEAETTELYIALTSGDEEAIRNAIESASAS